MNLEHWIIVEPDQVAQYQAAIDQRELISKILPLDLSYKDRYELCDDLGLTKSTGPGPARNFAWDHSICQGFTHHWVMDDNIQCFYRLNRNMKHKMFCGSGFRAMEEFFLRYENLAMVGPQYAMFAPRKYKLPPIVLNTRIYSCNLIRNDLPFRWRGRYNEDTILSLDLLKAGWCTVEFNAFLQNKLQTQLLSGGCTQEFYHAEEPPLEGADYSPNGTVAKSQMLASIHPDVARVSWKFNRWHHQVDYSGFRTELKLRPGVSITPEINEFGMKLVETTGVEMEEPDLRTSFDFGFSEPIEVLPEPPAGRPWTQMAFQF